MMSTAFKVGVFAIFTLVAVFVIWAVLNNFSLRRNGYQIAIHFRNVVGLQSGSSVQLAGVDIGVVDKIDLLPDQTASVICSIDGDKTIYRGSIFTVAPTLTGAQSTLEIIPPTNLATAIPLPKHVLPEAEQPEGTVPPTITELVSEGQKRMQELDKTLAVINRELPGIVRNFNDVAVHTNGLIVHADRNFNQLGQQLNMTIASVNTIVAQLNGILTVNGRNITAMTTGLQRMMSTSGPKVAILIDNLAATSTNLNKTMASVQSIAADPSVKTNLLSTAANLKESSEKLKAIATDIQSVTGDPKVQGQLRSTVQNLDDAIAKADAILGSIAVARGVGQPEPLPSGTQAPPASGGSPGPQPPPRPRRFPGFHIGGGRGDNPLELASGEMRLYWNNKPAGALSDLNVVLLPRFPTHLTLGVNSLGFNPTYNVLVNMRSSPNLQYSFGVLNSNLGVRTRLTGLGPFGIDARLYNTRQPQLDLYGDLRLAMRLQLFYGEKALMGPAANRTPQFGLQFGY